MDRPPARVRALWPGLALISPFLAASICHAEQPSPPVNESTLSGDRPADNGSEVEEAALTQQQPPLIPVRPLEPPPRLPGEAGTFAAQLLGPSGANRSLLSDVRRERTTGLGPEVVSGSEAKPRSTSDTGSLLGKSNTSPGVGTQRRTPIVTDPRARGSSSGQQLASGSYWFPARQDLDTLLSKIDSRLVQDVIVVKGPYSAIYGPGTSFYDVGLIDSPRFADGPEVHGSTGFDYQTNGQQWYGRQDLWGGSDDWGIRAGYGHRTGNDYETGNGSDIPSSYKSRDAELFVGFDPSPDSRVELSYLRLDQTNVEFPGQLFDMNFLVTDAFDLRYSLTNQAHFDRLTFETWYNRTRFEGDSQRSGKREQIPILDSLSYKGFTDADAMSTGFSVAATWGLPDCPQLTIGTDLRYITQRLNEFDLSPAFNTSFAQDNFNFPIPPSHSSNPGLFVQQTIPVGQRLRIKSGGRADWVGTNADHTVPHADFNNDGRLDDLEQFLGGDFDRDFFLWSAFIVAQYEVCPHWTASGGFGYGMRPPTLTELYATGTVLGILQQGLTFTTGQPNLDAERRWQIDMGLAADYERLRAGLNVFHAWVNDYITYETIGLTPGFGFVQFTNTDWATLAGGEAYAEYDWNSCTTPFATMSYVEGRDHTRDSRGALQPPDFHFSEEEPLPGIPPLESRIGVRFHQSSDKPRWIVEFSARIVDNQDRVASSLLEQETAGFTTYDLRAMWRATDNSLLVAGVENLTDKQYREHLDLRTGTGVFQPGVNFYFGAQVVY